MVLYCWLDVPKLYAQQRLHWQVKVLEGLAVVKESLKKVATIQQNNLKKQLPSLGTSKVTWGPWCCFITKVGSSSGKSSTFQKKENFEHCWTRHSLLTWVTDFSQLSLAPSTAYTAIKSSSLKGRKAKSVIRRTHITKTKGLNFAPFTTCLQDWVCVKSQNSWFALFFIHWTLSKRVEVNTLHN